MGSVSFADRFELIELIRGDQVQTFRARERATGRDVEAHLSASLDLLAQFESQPGISVIDRGSHEGRFYIVAAPLRLDSVGAWQIKPNPIKPIGEPQQKAPPGDFTRMFELRQAPEPVATPEVKAVHAPVSAAQPGEFTRLFKKPAAAPSAAPSAPSVPGQEGEFTRMFQKPVTPPAPPTLPDAPPAPAPARIPVGLIITAIVMIAAIAVFVLVRTLY